MFSKTNVFWKMIWIFRNRNNDNRRIVNYHWKSLNWDKWWLSADYYYRVLHRFGWIVFMTHILSAEHEQSSLFVNVEFLRRRLRIQYWNSGNFMIYSKLNSNVHFHAINKKNFCWSCCDAFYGASLGLVLIICAVFDWKQDSFGRTRWCAFVAKPNLNMWQF